MQKEFLFAGFGGQGVMFAGQLLAYAAMEEGLEVTWIPSYGPEMRGGTAHCFVVISDKPIGSPVTRHPKVAVAFNLPSFTKYEPVVAAGGLLAVNASLVEPITSRTDITQLRVPATQIADEVGDLRLANVVMLGAVLTAYQALPLDALRRALEKHTPEHRRNLLNLNYQALARGAELAAGMVQSA
ncbi:MAG: 2-oxoacid:acceptor oxidoreductase family protein [Chloroflexi bacterium]|nr:2-oxoacid:acceptor oxidoreductase family protein [Chloroflexota bacterium]